MYYTVLIYSLLSVEI